MIANAFYAWALREINPLHCDVPTIILRKHAHEERLKKFYERAT